ncbi:phosphopantetheine-binding protein [Legionella sp. PATHC035]|uniref:acyl carrier protein n=1 Tax=Legionella sp. PATHC035 TaxID=2992040 RepID=UPI00224468B9|nr:phosphopantetheine-binding protein [Legionella sp. PATHC035]MCW8409442.1 phosphopantetheine-binding protein [Legionella sp. PATHC035]
MEQTVERRVVNLIARTQEIPPDEIDLDQSIDQVVPSSLDLVNLFFDLEDEFDLDIRNDIYKEQTIREIAIDIKQLIAKKS